MVKWLSSHPERWSKIYACSRRPPLNAKMPNVEFHAIDLLSTDPTVLAADLQKKGIAAEYVLL